jgi:hypothetical protein
METIIDNAPAILSVTGSAIEVALRLLPTKKNYSILTAILRIIDFLIPNRIKKNENE